MDAKSKANFINSVADGSNIPCSSCGASNPSDSKFCFSCGAEIVVLQESVNDMVAFEPTKEMVEAVKEETYSEPNNVFAQGLPEWSIEPPQVMVRRP